MPITVLSDVILSNAVLSAGVRGKNVRLNNRIRTENGEQSINIVWSQSLREYELGTVPLRVEDWQDIAALHEITEGGAYGFLMEDPADNKVEDGSAAFISEAVGYQLQKRYIDTRSGRYKDRPITRPRASGFVLYVDGVELSAGSYTLNVNNGTVIIPSLPAAQSVSWDGQFYVPVHFRDDAIDWDLVVAGVKDQRFLAGPLVVLSEVREYQQTISGVGTSAPVPSDLGIDAPPATPAPYTPGIPAPAPNPDPQETPVGDVFPVGVAGNWVLTFRDEFDGSALDETKWVDEIWYGDNPFGVGGANIPHTEQNYDLSGGTLRIWPYKNGGRFMNRTITTDGKFYQTYGYFETRMKFPVGQGVWSGFWTYNHDGSLRPEIDIVELYAGGGDGWGTVDNHPLNYGGTVWNTEGATAGAIKLSDFASMVDLSENFHVYGADWRPDGSVQFYFDGLRLGPAIQFANRQRMFALINLWFGSVSGDPSDALTPVGSSNSLLVDYVRIWQAA